jgi:hypothetical protein
MHVQNMVDFVGGHITEVVAIRGSTVACILPIKNLMLVLCIECSL